MKPTPGAATAKKIPRDEWEKRLAEVKINKQDLNKLVMNYLVIEGYKDAAEKFAHETGLEPTVELESIEDRMNIRNAVQNGDIDQAIAQVNDLDPEILDVNPKLYFHLQQQKLIELIRTGDVSAALDFAQDELAPRGEENPEFLADLERTMALLAFPPTAIPTTPLSDLLDQSQRQRIASELNSAVLVSQSQDDTPKLPGLVRMLLWSQGQLEERASFPRIRDVVTSNLEEMGQ